MLFLVFFGEVRTPVGELPGRRIEAPLVILALLSSLAGFVELPPLFGDFRPLSEFLGTVLPPLVIPHESGTELFLLFITESLQAAGVAIAYWLFLRSPRREQGPRAAALTGSLRALWSSGWGFDWLYTRLFVDPLAWFARVNRRDAIDDLFSGIARASQALHRVASRTQTGSVRWYAAGVVLGAVIVLGIVILS
jgi:NADH-quinone oxidoreductase subunit L